MACAPYRIKVIQNTPPASLLPCERHTNVTPCAKTATDPPRHSDRLHRVDTVKTATKPKIVNDASRRVRTARAMKGALVRRRVSTRSSRAMSGIPEEILARGVETLHPVRVQGEAFGVGVGVRSAMLAEGRREAAHRTELRLA